MLTQREQKMLKIIQNRTNQNILTKIQNHIYYIILNRPKRGNAFTMDMYYVFTQHILKANQQSNIKYIVVYGQGNNFSTGNDLNNFKQSSLNQFTQQEFTNVMNRNIVFNFSLSIIKSQKPIFGIVYGRATGIGFTQLLLYDKVFVTQNTLFQTPFIKIAQGPELCSSFIFPKVFGKKLAHQLIVDGRTIGIKQLQPYGVFTICKDSVEAHTKLNDHIRKLNELDWESYISCRNLMRSYDLPKLIQLNTQQFANLRERIKDPIIKIYVGKHLKYQKQKRAKL